jgi:hypothetical protein
LNIIPAKRLTSIGDFEIPQYLPDPHNTASSHCLGLSLRLRISAWRFVN